ncbi:uncharacterized protein LOC102808006 [Saccoglossus kowalevskii]
MVRSLTMKELSYRPRAMLCRYFITSVYIIFMFVMISWLVSYTPGNVINAMRKMGWDSDVDYIHVVTATDSNFFPGVAALVNSLRISTHVPERIKIHVLVCGDEYDVTGLREYLECHGIKESHLLELVRFDTNFLDEDLISSWEGMFVAKRLRSSCNYARSYLYRSFPDLKKVIYLDSDIVAKQPIESLWRLASQLNGVPLLAVDNNRTYIDDKVDVDTVSKLYFKRYGRHFDPTLTVFNGGVLVMDLDFFRKYHLIDEVEFWIDQYDQSPVRLWRFDCQSIFHIIYHEFWGKLNHKWNCKGLGRDMGREQDLIDSGALLHWSAANKPWNGEGPYVELWKQYKPAECSLHGQCHHNPNATIYGYYNCKCDTMYYGTYCQHKR